MTTIKVSASLITTYCTVNAETTNGAVERMVLLREKAGRAATKPSRELPRRVYYAGYFRLMAAGLISSAMARSAASLASSASSLRSSVIR